MEKELKKSLNLLRKARNNMSKQEFQEAVSKLTKDANIAEPLIIASSQVSYERMKQLAENG